MKANTKNANSTILLDEGLETFNLAFKGRDDVVAISFNPSDPDLILRLEKSIVNIDEAIAGVSDDDTGTEKLKKINEAICEQVDFIFGNNISDKVFKHCSPLATNSKGELFVERFMDAVTPYIRDRAIAARKASEARMAKHTAKYAK